MILRTNPPILPLRRRNRSKFLGWGSQGCESMIQARDDGSRP